MQPVLSPTALGGVSTRVSVSPPINMPFRTSSWHTGLILGPWGPGWGLNASSGGGSPLGISGLMHLVLFCGGGAPGAVGGRCFHGSSPTGSPASVCCEQ